MNGLLVIDKPGGMTSRTALNAVQRWFPSKTKLGHTGTLDPLATGVLVVCVGAATRLADYVQAMGKSYMSRFRLGATSTTDDADGVVTETPDAVPPTCEQLGAALASFVGTIKQVPPAVSALKVDGQRAHAIVRKGGDVELEARSVRIDAIRLTAYAWPFADVEVDCGKGTYIRSIARDVGAQLACGGLVQTLRRTRVGPFTVEHGIEMDADPKQLKLLPMTMAVADMAQLRLHTDDVNRLRSGQSLRHLASSGREPPEGTELALLNEAGELIGIGVWNREQLKPQVVLGG